MVLARLAYHLLTYIHQSITATEGYAFPWAGAAPTETPRGTPAVTGINFPIVPLLPMPFITIPT